MKVRCLNCGLVLEKCLSLKCVCPECGVSNWGICINYEDTMMGLTMKARDKEEKIDDLYMATINFTAREWLKKKGYMYFEKMGVPDESVKHEKEEGLAFEIFEVEDGKKVKVRKIYLNGHIEGFKGDPCIVNHAYPKLMQLRGVIVDMLRQMNKDYRDFIERHLLADLPIDPIDLSKLYQSELERIMNIVPTI